MGGGHVGGLAGSTEACPRGGNTRLAPLGCGGKDGKSGGCLRKPVPAQRWNLPRAICSAAGAPLCPQAQSVEAIAGRG